MLKHTIEVRGSKTSILLTLHLIFLPVYQLHQINSASSLQQASFVMLYNSYVTLLYLYFLLFLLQNWMHTLSHCIGIPLGLSVYLSLTIAVLVVRVSVVVCYCSVRLTVFYWCLKVPHYPETGRCSLLYNR